ncbi:hypothetical protein NHF56_04005 [Rhizobium sp. L1K21]|nr:hypothetical protein [Rhizobium sp. L1K21]
MQAEVRSEDEKFVFATWMRCLILGGLLAACLLPSKMNRSGQVCHVIKATQAAFQSLLLWMANNEY